MIKTWKKDVSYGEQEARPAGSDAVKYSFGRSSEFHDGYCDGDAFNARTTRVQTAAFYLYPLFTS